MMFFHHLKKISLGLLMCCSYAQVIDSAKIEESIKKIEKDMNDSRVFKKDRSEQLIKFKQILKDINISHKDQIQRRVEDNINSEPCHYPFIELLNDMPPETKKQLNWA